MFWVERMLEICFVQRCHWHCGSCRVLIPSLCIVLANNVMTVLNILCWLTFLMLVNVWCLLILLRLLNVLLVFFRLLNICCRLVLCSHSISSMFPIKFSTIFSNSVIHEAWVCGSCGLSGGWRRRCLFPTLLAYGGGASSCGGASQWIKALSGLIVEFLIDDTKCLYKKFASLCPSIFQPIRTWKK